VRRGTFVTPKPMSEYSILLKVSSLGNPPNPHLGFAIVIDKLILTFPSKPEGGAPLPSLMGSLSHVYTHHVPEATLKGQLMWGKQSTQNSAWERGGGGGGEEGGR
jgi:hypothetical protein